MTQRLLVLGSTGMLGHKLTEALSHVSEFEVHASMRGIEVPVHGSALEVEYHGEVDLADGTSKVATLLRRLRPDIVVNAIGAIKQRDIKHAVDDTLFVNGALPHALALLNPNPAGRILHFSTDCVFVGDRGSYRESSRADAEDLYGRSKAIGELAYGRHLTLRTSIVGFEFGAHLGLLAWLFKQPLRSTLRGFTHAIYSGLPTVTLARTVCDVLARFPSMNGLFHVASEPITKWELLHRINLRFELGHHIEPDPSLVVDKSLNDDVFRALTNTQRPGWTALIEELYRDFHAGPYPTIYEALRRGTHSM